VSSVVEMIRSRRVDGGSVNGDDDGTTNTDPPAPRQRGSSETVMSQISGLNA